jgi:glycosyltransferase involved in cell wall biosynthesis
VQVSRNQRIQSEFVDIETMGRTYMEAGGCGVPVIASRVGGVPSVVEHGKNGLLVDDPEDVEEVVEKITIILGNPELRSKIGVCGIRLAKKKFSWGSVGASFEGIMINASSLR